MRRHLRPVLLAFALVLAFLTGTGGSASASDACTSGHNASGQVVYYCGVWVPSGGVPVYASTSQTATVIDHLHTGGTANWFYCSQAGGTAKTSTYASSNWARTMGDDHGAIGYVPAIYFSGAENYWNGLPACGGASSGGGTKCNAGNNHAGDNVYFCPIWVPSGGVPVYSSTSTSSTVVDRLNSPSGNWFYCQQNGSSASASGYTSSNWARTVGDNNGATGYVPAVYFAGAQNYWYGMGACSDPAPPPPADGTCTAGHNSAGKAVYYCPVWVPSGGVPLYKSTSPTSGVVDHLYTGGSANWFYCSLSGTTATVGGYSSSSWAKTVGDSSGATGWVPAVYFTGSQNYWPNLPKCSTSIGNPPPPAPSGNGGVITSGKACGYSYSSILTKTLKLMQQMCRVTVSTDSIYKYRIYSWNGGHGAAPGPTYGNCVSGDAWNDCHVDGFDCSGLVRWAYYETTGLDDLDGYTGGQWNEALSLPHKAVVDGASRSGGYVNIDSMLGSLKPGDILFYGTNASQHVAVYMGNGKQMNAYNSGYADGVTNVTTGDTFWGAVRMW